MNLSGKLFIGVWTAFQWLHHWRSKQASPQATINWKWLFRERGRASWTLLHPRRMLMHPILCRQPQLQWAHECNYHTMFRKHLFVCFCSTFLYPLFFLKLCFWPLLFSVLRVLEGVIEMSCLGLSTPWSLIIDSLTSYESQQ